MYYHLSVSLIARVVTFPSCTPWSVPANPVAMGSNPQDTAGIKVKFIQVQCLRLRI